MRYGVAIAISMILILGTFVFVMLIDRQMQLTQDFGAKLPGISLAAMSTARLFRRWWYVFLFLYIAIPMVIAAIFPHRNAE